MERKAGERPKRQVEGAEAEGWRLFAPGEIDKEEFEERRRILSE